MGATKAVRLPDTTYEAVRLLAGDEPMHTVIAEAVEKLRRERFMDEVNAGFAALRADPALWAQELEERALWERTLADGLEDDPYPPRPGDLP